MTSTTSNSILLFLTCTFLLLSALLKTDGIGWPTYMTLFMSVLLVINAIVRGAKLWWGFVGIMCLVMLFHYLLTPDKITTAILLCVTIFLYESVDKGSYSYKWILYLFIVTFMVGLVLTIPSFVHGLTSAHSTMSDRNQSIFHNPNTYSAFCLMTIMCVILFMKPSKFRLLLLLLLVLNVYSTGSRNGVMFIIISFCFYYLHKSKFAKYSYLLAIIFMLLSTYYLFYIEPSQAAIDIDVMGRSATSAGRSTQIIYIIKNFPLKLFGNGKDIIDASVNTIDDYSVHNFYVNSLYSLGIIPLLAYLYYVHHLWKTLSNIVAKSLLLAFNIYFFFEPGTCFYLVFLTVTPIMIIMLSRQGQKKRIIAKQSEL